MTGNNPIKSENKGTKRYLADFWKRMKKWVILFLIFDLASFISINPYLSVFEHFVYVFLPRLLGGLIGLVIIYFFKYMDKDLKIK
jgi:hypothetical protein